MSPKRSNTCKIRVTQRLNNDFLPQRWSRWSTCHFLQLRCSVPPASSTLPRRFNIKWEKHPSSSAIYPYCWGESLCLIISKFRKVVSTESNLNSTVKFHFNTVKVSLFLVYILNSSACLYLTYHSTLAAV